MRLFTGLVLSIALLVAAAGCRDVLGIHAARSGDADVDNALDPGPAAGTRGGSGDARGGMDIAGEGGGGGRRGIFGPSAGLSGGAAGGGGRNSAGANGSSSLAGVSGMAAASGASGTVGMSETGTAGTSGTSGASAGMASASGASAGLAGASASSAGISGTSGVSAGMAGASAGTAGMSGASGASASTAGMSGMGSTAGMSGQSGAGLGGASGSSGPICESPSSGQCPANQSDGSRCSGSSLLRCGEDSSACLRFMQTECASGVCRGDYPNAECIEERSVGWPADLGSSSPHITGGLAGTRITLPGPALLRRFGIISRTAGTHAILILYDEQADQPHTRIAATTNRTLAAGVNEFEVGLPPAEVPLSAGAYWLMVSVDADTQLAHGTASVPLAYLSYTHGSPIPNPLEVVAFDEMPELNFYIVVLPQ